MRIEEGQQRLAEALTALDGGHTVGGQAIRPEVEAGDRHGERHFADRARAGAAGAHAPPGEEGELGARRAGAVGVEQVIGVGRVLIHRLLDEAHAEDADVEVDVLLRIAGVDGDVVQACDGSHDLFLPPGSRRAPGMP